MRTTGLFHTVKEEKKLPRENYNFAGNGIDETTVKETGKTMLTEWAFDGIPK
jgi:hypothetical protein